MTEYNLVGLFIFNWFVYERFDAYNQSNLMQAKFVVGMILASITMFIAGTVEKFRQNSCSNGMVFW